MNDKKSEKAHAEEQLSRRARLLMQGLEIASVAAKGGRVALASSVRGAMPILEAYSGIKASSFKKADDAVDDAEEGPRILDLSPGQTEVVKAAGTKMFGEVLEVASVTHPVYDGAPVYAIAVDGQAQTPHLVHFLALAAAARDLFGDDEVPEMPQEEPFFEIEPQRTVAYLSLAPGEYERAVGPQTPTQIRRAAMRERTNSPPPPAMLASNNQPVMMTNNQPVMMTSAAGMTHGHKTAVVPFYGAAQGFTRAGAATAAPVATQCCGSGCACGCSCASGGSGCSCGRCGHGVPFGGARYLEDGSCAPIGNISCETRWRVRDCFKYAFCDMLRCMGEEMCDDDCKLKEETNVGDCVEVFLCSLINCLPDAICPPEKPKLSCPPETALGCHCNFAVGK